MTEVSGWTKKKSFSKECSAAASVWDVIIIIMSNTRKSVSPDVQTLRSRLKNEA